MSNTATKPLRAHSPQGIRNCLLHEHKAEHIAQLLRKRKSTAPLARHKRTVSHKVPKVGDKKYSDDKIDLRSFDQVLEIDPVRKICIAEPGVPFCKLVEQTLAYGLVPTVVPELKTITIGGAVAECFFYHRFYFI